MNIFNFINNLDKSGNFKLADKIENEIKKVYAQAVRQTPGPQGNHMLDPNFAFILNQLLLKEQAKMTTKKETDTLSPTKNTDIPTIRKQLNKVISDMTTNQKKVKNLENSLGAIPTIESKIGEVAETTDGFDQKITTNTSGIERNTEDINSLFESVDTLKK